MDDDIRPIVDLVLEEIRLQRAGAGNASFDPATVADDVDAVLSRLALPPDIDARARGAVFAAIDDLGPIAPYLSDPGVSEIIVTGEGRVQVERDGLLSFTDTSLDDSAAELLGERIALRYGRKWDAGENQTLLLRLADGSRIRLVHRPMGYHTYLNLRRYLKKARTVEELVALGELSRAWADWLGLAIAAGFNIVVGGSTGAGKTTLLDALVGAFVPQERRILVVEEVRELHTSDLHPNVAQLESSVLPGLARGEGLRRLLATALTMRPDVLVVGEVSGAEALEMVQAMLSGHPTYTTLHTRDARHSALSRLTYMLRLAEPGMPHEVLYEQVRSAVDLVLHLRRFPDGRRRLTEIVEVLPPWQGGEALRLVAAYNPARDAFSDLRPLSDEREARLRGGV